MRRPELVALLLLVACKRETPGSEPRIDAAAAPDREAPTIVDASLDVAVDAQEVDASVDPEPPRDPHARRVKSIGHTSVVFKIELTSGKKAVFKPHSKRGPGRYKGEIAAYGLARALGLDAVPRAFATTFAHAELVTAAKDDEKAAKLLADDVIVEEGRVKGALTMWIDDYEVLPLEKEPLFSQVRGWLKKGSTIPPEKLELARATSTLIVFDYLTGNWDRWSGANVAMSEGRVLYVDNDGAFFENPPKDGLARNERMLKATDRFSRSFVEKLRSLSDEDLSAPLDVLSKKAIDGVRARRREALAILEHKELDLP